MSLYPIQKLQHAMPHLVFFWQVCEHQSFTVAAERLCVTQSTVSYQIKALEEKLNVKLLDRSSRKGIQLTEEGERLATISSQLLEPLQRDLFQLCEKSRIHRTIKISAPAGVIGHCLLQASQQLQLESPVLSFDFQVSDALDTDGEELLKGDIFLFYGYQDREDLVQIPLMKCHTQLVASREYLAAKPPIKSNKDLGDHTAILYRSMKREWLNQFSHIKFPRFGEIVYIDNTYAILEAVSSGLGMTYLPDYVAREKLDSGEYQSVLSDYFKDFYIEYFLAYKKADSLMEEVANNLVIKARDIERANAGLYVDH